MRGHVDAPKPPPRLDERPTTRKVTAALLLRDAVVHRDYLDVLRELLAELADQVEAYGATAVGKAQLKKVTADGSTYLTGAVEVVMPPSDLEHPEPA